MKDRREHSATKTEAQPRVISIRLIVTAVAVLLVSAAVLGAAAVSERNSRRGLMRTLETRLALEARNLSMTSTNALLTQYPELTLHPIVKDMKAERPDLELVVVVDHERIIQGHADANRLGTEFTLQPALQPQATTVKLAANEEMVGNDDLIVLTTNILHPNGSPMGQVIVGLQRRHAEALLMATRKNQILFFLPLLAASILLTMILMSRVLRPISAIRTVIEKIGRGDLDSRIEVSSRTELSLVARSINNMAAEIKRAQADLLEKERLGHEMELAHDIQRSLLPKQGTMAGDLHVVGAQEAAAEVGGDYYDVFPLPDGRLGIVIADVAGKGLSGCLITSMLAILIRSLRASHARPSDLIVAVHEIIVDSIPPAKFITMFYGMIDPRTGRMTFASAGHNPLLHCKATGECIAWHHTDGVPVGLVKDDSLRTTLVDATIDLAPGDLVLLTTDGFNEAINEAMAEYGFDRLADTVSSLAAKGGQQVIDGVQKAVSAWEGGQPAIDDKTLVAIAKSPASVPANGNQTEPVAKRELPAHISNVWKDRSQGNFLSAPARLDVIDNIGGRLRRCRGLERVAEIELCLLEQGLYEILANIIEHACSLDASKTIDVWWMPHPGHPGRGHFLIRDDGAPPAPEQWTTSDAHRSRGRGYGLQLIEQTLADVGLFPSTPDGNIALVSVELPCE